MKKIITLLVSITLAILPMILFAGVRDLPTKKAGGKEYYYYKVKKGESVAGIAKHLGITPQELVEHNPRAAGGVDKKTTLYFPVEAYTATEVADVPDVVAEQTDTIADLQPAIVIALPFGLDKAEPSRANRLALDFYKGFLLAADTLTDRAGQIKIIAIDTESADINKRLADTDVATAQIIVAPNDPALMQRLCNDAAERGSWVLNVFNVPDTLYLANTQMLQANVPQRTMYTLAADAFINEYPGYTPVVLRCTSGRNEKEPFISYLTERLSQHAITPIEIAYDQSLLSADLDILTPGGKYVFIPTSGALSDFNKFAYVLKAYRERRTAEALQTLETDAPIDSTEYALFGYPDWTVFRGDALDLLHKLEARVYSRFFDNFNSFNARSLEETFRYWYGEDIIESVPSQATLGYDTGCYLIKNIHANKGEYNPLNPARFSGLQSTFDFDRADDAGYYNSTLYIITYLPDGSLSSHTL